MFFTVLSGAQWECAAVIYLLSFFLLFYLCCFCVLHKRRTTENTTRTRRLHEAVVTSLKTPSVTTRTGTASAMASARTALTAVSSQGCSHNQSGPTVCQSSGQRKTACHLSECMSAHAVIRAQRLSRHSHPWAQSDTGPHFYTAQLL